jgi:hypothetical protein
MLIFLLELVGDEFKNLAIQLRKKDLKELNSKKIIEFLNEINEQLKIFYELYYKFDKEKLKQLGELNKGFLDRESVKKNGSMKEDVLVTLGAINRYIDVLSEILIAKQVSTHTAV